MRSLIIDGNLVLDYLNGAKIPDWISLLESSSSPDVEGNFEFEELIIDNLKLLEPVNNVSVEFLMKDAVQRNANQVKSH